MIYYTADTHFNDDRIIYLCKRPFKTLKEMTETICRNWNSMIDENDEVFILGDFAITYTRELGELIDSLNGKKSLIPGNHDKELLMNDEFRQKMRIRDIITTINDSDRSVTLCHYPLAAFDGSLTGGYHMYGHVHNNYNEPNYKLLTNMVNSFNVGVDVNLFKPLTLDEAIGRRDAA